MGETGEGGRAKIHASGARGVNSRLAETTNRSIARTAIFKSNTIYTTFGGLRIVVGSSHVLATAETLEQL